MAGKLANLRLSTTVQNLTPVALCFIAILKHDERITMYKSIFLIGVVFILVAIAVWPPPLVDKKSTQPLFVLSGHTLGDEFGHSVSSLGDLNGDDVNELLIGAPNEDIGFSNAGAGRVYSGRDKRLLMTLAGDGEGWHHGSGVGNAGDVDGDGLEDIVIGMRPSGNTGRGPGGGARVFSGRSGEVLHVLAGSLQDDKFGSAVDSAGDVNGDGYADIIVGAPGTYAPGIYKMTTPGYAVVFSGADGAVLYSLRGLRSKLGDRFGFSVSGAGDVDGDGLDDLLVGGLWDDDHGDKSGAAYLFSGRDGSIYRRFLGEKPGDEFGHSVSAVGDLDGDGRPEQFVGAFSYTDIGYARVFSSKDGRMLYEFHGEMKSDGFGHSVSNAGDVNGDGLDDLLVGASSARLDPNARPWKWPRFLAPDAPGYAKVYSGKDGSLIATWWGEHDIHLGYSVASAGDINLDGFADMILGTTLFDDVGQAWVVSACAVDGAAEALTKSLLKKPHLSWLPPGINEGQRMAGKMLGHNFPAGANGSLAVCEETLQLAKCSLENALYTLPFTVPENGGPATIEFTPKRGEYSGHWAQLAVFVEEKLVATNNVRTLFCR